MNSIVIDDLIAIIKESVDQHRLAPGCYCRYLWNNAEGTRKMGRNEYGCADAANILYTIGAFPTDPEERSEFIRHLREMQDPESGQYFEDTHHSIHTTAHCTAALELFDAKPLYPAKGFEKYTTKAGLYELLESDAVWETPWPGSHQGAGILPSLTNTDMVGLEWKNWYFDWMWEHSDPELGFVTFGPHREPIRNYMCGGFHYMFNHEAEHRPLRYPEKIIDFCLELMSDYEKHGLMGNLAVYQFIDVDVIYSLSRAMRQSPHRFYEGKAAIEKYAEEYIPMLKSVDFAKDESFNDLHMLFGAVCCLAELQSALPGKILTSKPLKLVLDRRPFI